MSVNPYTYSFSGVSFSPAAEDFQPMVGAPPLLSSERHVPYSDYTVLDLGGKQARHFISKIRLLPSQVATFEALLGTTHELEVAGVEWPSATLIKLENHTMTPRGEYHYYDADWVVG